MMPRDRDELDWHSQKANADAATDHYRHKSEALAQTVAELQSALHALRFDHDMKCRENDELRATVSRLLRGEAS